MDLVKKIYQIYYVDNIVEIPPKDFFSFKHYYKTELQNLLV